MPLLFLQPRFCAKAYSKAVYLSRQKNKHKGLSKVYDIHLPNPTPLSTDQKHSPSTTASPSSTTPSPAPASFPPALHQPQNILDQDHAQLAYIRNLPVSFSEKDVYQYLQREMSIQKVSACITQVQLIRNALGASTGKAILSFSQPQDCLAFTERFDKLYLETKDHLQELTVRNYDLKTKQKRLAFDRNHRTVYLYNIPFKWAGSDVYALAEHYGTLENIQVPLNSAQTKNKGYALLQFQTPQQAHLFQEQTHDHTIEGRKLQAQVKDFKFDTQKKNIMTRSDLIFSQGFPFQDTLLKANLEVLSGLDGGCPPIDL